MTRAFLEDIPEARFTESTIRRMFELVDKAKTDEKFQKLIYGIVNKSMRGNWKDYRREVEVLLEWFKKRHDYRRDPHNVELLQDVWATLDRRRFDCDDATIFMCSGSEILGAPCRIVTVSTRENREPSHVYIQAFLEGSWQGIDAIMPWSTVGWEPTDGITARKIWTRRDVGLAGYEEPAMEGLGRMRYLENSNPEGWTDDRYNVGPRKNYEGGFAQRMSVVNPTGIPNDGSDTFAPGMPGSAVIPNRRTPSSLILSLADGKRLPLPGDIELSRYPIISHETPGQLWTLMPGNKMPLDFNKDQWTGEVPVNQSVVDYTLPQPYASGDEIVDLAGLGGFGMYSLEGISDDEVEAELEGLSDDEIVGQLEQLGYFLGNDEDDDGMLGKRGKRRSPLKKHKKMLAKHKKMHKKSMSMFKKRKPKGPKGFEEIEEKAEALSPGEQENGTPPIAGLGANHMTDSYLANAEYGNPGYLADAYVDAELQMAGVRLGQLTRGERDKVRHAFRNCVRGCRKQFKGNNSRFDGLGTYVTEQQLERQSMSGLGGLGANHMTDSYLANMRGLGAIDWASAVSGIAANVVSGVTGGAIPAQTVQSAINTGVAYYQGSGQVPTTQQIAQQAPPPIVAKAAFSVGALVPIGIGIFILSKVMGKKGRRR